MKMRKNIKTLFIVIAIVAGFVHPAQASGGDGINLTLSGSISVTLEDNATNKSVSGAELNLYQVASVYKSGYQLTYTFTDEFKDCGMSLDDLRQDGLEIHLSSYADQQGLSAVATETTDSNGLALFPNLETGLYLVRQTKAADGYYSMDPFLVTIPMTIDNEWVYDVDASPKVEAKPDHQNPSTTQLTVNKVWVSNGVAIPGSVFIALLRDGIAYKTEMLNNTNDWSYTWFGLDTNYTWDVVELNVPDGYKVGYTYHGTVVKITNFRLVESPEEPTPEKPENPDTPPLIQTGQLNWPVLVLSGLGILLLVLGWVLVVGKKKNYYE